MANEIRLRRNNQTGTITDNPLAIGATTINSAAFTLLPTVDATNHLLLILDPLGATGTPEIVRVTAHTAAATSCTIVRAQEGSTARSFVFNTTWFWGPVASDYSLSDVTSGTRPSVPYTGELILETDTKKLMGYTGTDWAPRDAGGTLGYAQVVANQTGIGAADTDLTSLTTAVTVGTNRRVRITGWAIFQQQVAVGAVSLKIFEGGGQLQNNTTQSASFGANGFITLVSVVALTPTAGAHTYKLAARTSSNTVDLNAGATFPAFILVEDIGAV